MSKSYLDVLDPPFHKDMKTELARSKDPYALYGNEFSINFGDFSISYPDIINYLAFRASQYFADDMEIHKSLEAYNQVIEG